LLLCAQEKSAPSNLQFISFIKYGFYKADLIVDNILKVTVIFPCQDGQSKLLLAKSLVLPMGCKNIPPIFCTPKETITNNANDDLNTPHYAPSYHHLDDLAHEVQPTEHPALSYIE